MAANSQISRSRRRRHNTQSASAAVTALPARNTPVSAMFLKVLTVARPTP